MISRHAETGTSGLPERLARGALAPIGAHGSPRRSGARGGRGPLRVLLATALGGMLLAACSSNTAPSAQRVVPAPAVTAPAHFSGHGSTDEAYALGATPGVRLIVADAAGDVVGSGVVDRLGGLIVRNLKPGTGYTFRQVDGRSVLGSKPFRVLSPSYKPPESFYSSQHMHAGLNYIKMRDGVTLAATVRLPPGKTLADGPFPTVIEYSGYSIAAPGNLIAAELTGKGKNSPLLPSTATIIGSLMAPLLGFASVSLQMRGTGCSGGAFDLFGLNTTLDGYDAVQIVASQPWVKYHRVGMVGISFSGISQMFVAGARPPGLAAIAPMSITNDLYATGFPGGIFNSGFAASWIAARIKDAGAAPAGGDTYSKALIADGNKQCLQNQVLHLETMNIDKLLAASTHRTPSLYDVRSPTTWARKIKVPVFLVGALQDEETGPQWPAIIPALAHDPDVFVSMINGTHIDSLGPATLSAWLEFLQIFVAREVPSQPGDFDLMASALYPAAAGAPAETPPPLQFTHAKDLAVARADFIKDTPRIRVLFGNGAGSLGPGAMQPVWQASFSQWPPRRAVPTTFYLGEHGLLASADQPSGTASFRPNPAARPATDLPASDSPWVALPKYDWTPVVGSEGLGFISPVLSHNEVVVGPASLNLMLESSAPDTDLQVTVSEVMPDGEEMYITSGFLRASDRALNRKESTVLEPVPTYLASTAKPLPPGKFTEVRIPIDPVVFAFRKGSRIRITISAPGGDRPEWAFDTFQTDGKVLDTVALGGARPSTLVLAVIPGLEPVGPQPACPSLRGEPCRRYVPAGNGG